MKLASVTDTIIPTKTVIALNSQLPGRVTGSSHMMQFKICADAIGDSNQRY